MHKSLIFLSLLVPLQASPRLTECLADPASASDDQAEFLELSNNTNLAWSDSLSITLNDKVVFADSIRIPSLASLVIGPQDLRQWLDSNSTRIAKSSISNSIALRFEIRSHGQLLDSGTIPKSKTGSSWMRTDTGWAISTAQAPWGDKASPGWDEAIVRRPDIDIQFKSCLDGEALWIIRGLPTPATIETATDDDWNGTPDQETDRVASEKDSILVRTALRDEQSHVLFTIRSQSYPVPISSSQTAFCHQAFSVLALDEVFPAPQTGQTEWFEVVNQWHHSIALDSFAINSSKLQIDQSLELTPGQRCVLAQDTTLFRAQFGAIRICLHQLSPWPGLSNDGDSLFVRWKGMGIDSLAWTKALSNTTYQRALTGLVPAKATPGYTISDSLRTRPRSGKSIYSQNEDWFFELANSDQGSYAIYDLHGKRRHQGSISEGKRFLHIPAASLPGRGIWILQTEQGDSHNEFEVSVQ